VRKGRIEIIPMIDTIFFLLVYFIMISLSAIRMDTHGVRCPVSATAQQRMQGQIVVSITKTGELFLDREPLRESELVATLQARLADEPSLAVVLNCDKERQVDLFLRVFDAVKRANPATVMIATSPQQLQGGGR
jgi:biopolymer transport protein ExbD